jgi:hypothetical protein
MSNLVPEHLAQLSRGSGISLDVIRERGYRSIIPPGGFAELKPHGFSRAQGGNLPGLLLPLWTTDGQNGMMVYRPDTPRQGNDGRLIKYEIPKNAGVRLDCPPRCQPMLKDPSISLWVTEGQKKADALASHGLCAIALLGVWGFKGKSPFGGTTFLADWDQISLKGREVRIVYDSDVMTKPHVRKALERLIVHLQRKGAHVVAIYLTMEGGKKVGVDEYLMSHTVSDLEGLIERPRPQPQPAAPIVELLDEDPVNLTRLLMLVDGRGYAETWLPTRTTTSERVTKDGEVIRLPAPAVTKERRLFVVRDDGTRYGDVVDAKVKPLSELPMTTQLPESLPRHLLWRTKAVLAYCLGMRPDPKDVFQRIVKVYDHFLDFSRSLDEQPRMCRLSACLSLMTWFADAFTVLPYPWPNSPSPGAGKTKWGHCWTKTSYLGCLTAASGSFAALRDLADIGATLMFDDAEVLADERKADPDKLVLILAGNRKGVEVPVKEQAPDGRWHTRWMNAYCPRGFTALRLPFRALQSRAIVLPLIASADSECANRDPENPDDWPVDQRQLRDDLWALTLSRQLEAAAVWTEMSKETSIVGREWERWRALITVARLFERHGVEQLEEDIRLVMAASHGQKDELEGQSRVVLVIRALIRTAGLKDSDVWTRQDVLDVSSETLKITASHIVEVAKGLLAEGDSGSDEDEEGEASPKWVNARSVGRILTKLRLLEDRASSAKRDRFRLVTPKEIVQLSLAHHIIHLSEETSKTSGNVQTSESCPACGQSVWMAVPGGDAVCTVCARKGAG